MVEETEDSLPKKRALYTMNSMIIQRFLPGFARRSPIGPRLA